MKKVCSTAIIILCTFISFAQKQPLTPEAIKNWPVILNEKISNDGKWVIYIIHKSGGEDTLCIQPVDNRWIEKIPRAGMSVITENSRLVIYQKNDSLFMYDLQKHKVATVTGAVQSYRTPAAGNGQWLAYQLNSADKRLVLHDLTNDQTRYYEHVMDYRFSDNGQVLLMQCNANNGHSVIQWIDLANAHTITILRNAHNAGNFVFDAAAGQLAFVADETDHGKSITTLRYYRKGMDSAVVRVNHTTPGLSSDYMVANGNIRFSPDGKRIIFPVKKVVDNNSQQPDNASDVTIWRYSDDYLPAEQTARLRYAAGRTYTAVVNNEENKVIQLNQENDEPFVDVAGNGNGDVALIRQNPDYYFSKWQLSLTSSYYIVNVNNGLRKKVITQGDINIQLSPTGKYVVWYDPVQKTYFTYETAGGHQRNITPQLAGTLCPVSQAMKLQPFMPFGIAGWLPNDQAMLIYDEFDIWKIDLHGDKAPVNLTNGYGKRHHIVLRIWNENNEDYSAPVINKGNVLLAAFNIDDKSNGFFTSDLSAIKDPVKLCLDPCLYYGHYRFNLQFVSKFSIHKAKNSNAYILRRMSSREYPNIYFTRDCKQFVALSQVHPQQVYNWLTGELISWKRADGATSQGILYKPENFDANKKYPVIFYFYEKLSQRLHDYLQPELSRGSINIPFFVSNGYLVCTPDISYTPGHPGESVYHSVVSAARYLSQFAWVDSTKMGIQGHSFGGYQVNYLVSRTPIFAAAQESAGASDFISYYNGFYREHSAQFYFEQGQGRLGYTLWQNPELYIQNSPVFKAHQVTTPLLIMHNKDDGEVPFQQGTEWFTALRRLGKKVWMLQYDKEYHGINQLKNKIDFTIRQLQFFDHFLKGAPAPRWMVNGISVH